MDSALENNKTKGCSSVFQIIVGIATIVSCCAAVIIVPPIQKSIELILYKETKTPTAIVIPTTTPYPTGFPTDTPANSILESGEIWSQNGFLIRIKNHTFTPRCNYSLLGFELTFQNNTADMFTYIFSGLDLTIKDNKETNYPAIFWNEGGLTDACWYYTLSNLQLNRLDAGGRADFAFYMQADPAPQSGTELFINIYKAGHIQNATWKIVVP